MERKNIDISGVPSTLWGKSSDKVYLYIHGKNGNKEEVEQFVDLFHSRGIQVLSIDLPEHGKRKEDLVSFEPWNIVPELQKVMKYLKENWNKVGIMANSIGAWFSLLSFNDEILENSLFIAPILNMEKLILKMMNWDSITEDDLRNKSDIKTNFGETISWNYYNYILDNKVTEWKYLIKILYPENDNMTDRRTIDDFVEKFNSELTLLKGSEHYIHKPSEIEFLRKWLKKNL